MKTALISVYNKEGIVEFAKQIKDLGFKILASGGTAKALTDAGIEVTDVASLVGGGAILGHRVVTLSREVHAGLLARDVQEDRAELEQLKIPFIDLVCVDLYPLEEEIKKVDSKQHTEDSRNAVLEKTDIGGPTMLRSAAKGRRIVIGEPSDRSKVIDWLKSGEPDRENFITSLCAKAEYIVANYVLASARYHSAGSIEGFISNQFVESKYGENAWQTPAGLMVGDNNPLSLAEFKLLAGTDPSFNNLADVDRLLQTMTHIAAGFEVNFPPPSPSPQDHPVPAKQKNGGPDQGGGNGPSSPPSMGGARGGWCIAVGVKHGNPCGAAVTQDGATAIQKMLEGDLRAIFGGVVMVNFPVDEKLAEVLLTHRMENGQRRLLDGIIAPSFTSEAIELLKRKGDKCRFLINPALANLSKDSLDQHKRFRYVRGGFLVQPNYTFILDLKSAQGGQNLEFSQKQDIILAWAVGSTSNSNTVTLVKDSMLIGNGVGQQDRVSCCELALKRSASAGHKTDGATAYSDSFFPFVDGPGVLASAGIKTIFATSGSVRDEEIKKFCEEKNIKFVTVPDKAGRGFFGH